jgi:hypothetical protein
MMLKVYNINHPMTSWACSVEINEEFIIQTLSEPDAPYSTKMLMKEMVLFWMGGKSRLKENDDDIAKTYLQQLGREILIILTEQDLNVHGVISEFENREGWSKLDGSFGIKLLDVDNVDIAHDEFEIEEL